MATHAKLMSLEKAVLATTALCREMADLVDIEALVNDGSTLYAENKAVWNTLRRHLMQLSLAALDTADDIETRV